MPRLDKRLADLEHRLARQGGFVVYQESLEPSERGMFRRGVGWRGRSGADLPPLLTRDQVSQDAGGATVILIEFASDWRGAEDEGMQFPRL